MSTYRKIGRSRKAVIRHILVGVDDKTRSSRGGSTDDISCLWTQAPKIHRGCSDQSEEYGSNGSEESEQDHDNFVKSAVAGG